MRKSVFLFENITQGQLIKTQGIVRAVFSLALILSAAGVWADKGHDLLISLTSESTQSAITGCINDGHTYLTESDSEALNFKFCVWAKRTTKFGGEATIKALAGGTQGNGSDYKQQFLQFKALAEEGNAVGQYLTASMMLFGLATGLPKNSRDAYRLFSLSAEQGLTKAQFQVGHMLMNGIGTSKSEKDAIRYYVLAAEAGDAQAQANLGLAFLRGNGVGVDKVSAAMWWSLAAANGSKAASQNLRHLTSELSAEQISLARGRIKECRELNFIGCQPDSI